MNLEILSSKTAPVSQSSQPDDLRLDPRSLPAASFDGLYVHVPFCFHKCHYCDFYSITRQSAERMTRFVDLVLAEARSWTPQPAGFERLNVDLIYAIPGQDLSSWAMSLEEAIALGTEHLSCYGLTYEHNTPMAVKKRLGTIRAVEDEIELEMLHHTRRRLNEAGFSPYEISNYAKRGEECRHNLLYWNGGSYLGLGPAAASHVEGHRWRNRPHLGEWELAVGENQLPAVDVEHLGAAGRASELIMLQLR